MNKLIPALLALVLCAALLAACGGPPSSFSIHPDADGHTGSVPAATPAGSEAPGQPAGPATSAPGTAGSHPVSTAAPESAGAADEIHSVTGTIFDTGMSKFYVELEDGLVIPFHYDGADVSGLLDTRPGNPITVYYTGQLVGNDASGVTVLRMETPAT